MLVIGERINATRKRIREAVLAGNADLIRDEARKQVEAGAHMLDVNGGIEGKEPEYLKWLVGIVQEVTDVPLCLDSADPDALRQALPALPSAADDQLDHGRGCPLRSPPSGDHRSPHESGCLVHVRLRATVGSGRPCCDGLAAGRKAHVGGSAPWTTSTSTPAFFP